MVKKCDFCNRTFMAIRKDQRFCDALCRLKARRTERKVYEERVCIQCGKMYKPIRFDQRFCFEKCRNLFYNKGQGKHVVCVECGKDFVTTTLRRTHCSTECYKIGKAKRDAGRERKAKER